MAEPNQPTFCIRDNEAILHSATWSHVTHVTPITSLHADENIVLHLQYDNFYESSDSISGRKAVQPVDAHPDLLSVGMAGDGNSDGEGRVAVRKATEGRWRLRETWKKSTRKIS